MSNSSNPADYRARVLAWFPPEQGPVLILGNPASVFPRHLAALWRAFGMTVHLVTRRWQGERALADGTHIMTSSDDDRGVRALANRAVERALSPVESAITWVQRGRYSQAMGFETSYRPRVTPALVDALSISRFVRRLRPQFVCGQEVFSYGPATALSGRVPRILMPWGGDIYMYANTSTLASQAVRASLRHVDLVVPGSPLAGDYLTRRFGVPPGRMHFGGLWALDRQRFTRATGSDRDRIRTSYGIPADAFVVMNVRRFFPAWGSETALGAFLRFAQEHGTAHFIMLGGAGTEEFVTRARHDVDRRGLSARFTLFDGDLALAECAKLMSIADVFVSFMREWDMRPLASILEAVACGAAPVLGDQPEYRAMATLGFRSAICPPGDEGAAVAALRRYAAHHALLHDTVAANLAYLDAHENGAVQALSLLERVHEIRRTGATMSRGPAG
jgi:glycosyltransferase involved in cell wall biosynthesis